MADGAERRRPRVLLQRRDGRVHLGAPRRAADEPPLSPATVPRAAPVPAPLRLDAPATPTGQPLQVLWFAQAETRSTPPGAVSLYQAMVLGRPSSGEAAKTFFEGLRLP